MRICKWGEKEKANVETIQNILQRSCRQNRNVLALSEISYVRLSFIPILEKYSNRKPSKVIEMNGEPDYGVGDFRIG